MTTASNLVSAALRKINSIDANEALNSNDFATGIDSLNRMAIRWEANGLSMGWSPVSNPSDVVNCPLENENALIYNLAMELAPEYGVPASQMVVALAQSNLAELRRDNFVSKPIYSNTRTPTASAMGAGTYWNIYTDGPNW